MYLRKQDTASRLLAFPFLHWDTMTCLGERHSHPAIDLEMSKSVFIVGLSLLDSRKSRERDTKYSSNSSRAMFVVPCRDGIQASQSPNHTILATISSATPSCHLLHIVACGGSVRGVGPPSGHDQYSIRAPRNVQLFIDWGSDGGSQV